MPDRIEIHLCVNNPDNGSPSGHVVGLEVITDSTGESALSLESIDMNRGPVCQIDDRLSRVKLGRFWFHIKAHDIWVGNWCWDSVSMEPSTAADLLNKVRASGWWTLESGFTCDWERWESGEPFTAEFLAADRLLTSADLT